MIKRTKNNMTGNNLDLLIINKYNINKYYIVINTLQSYYMIKYKLFKS